MDHCHSGLFCDSRAYNVSNVQLIQLNDGSCEVIQLFVFVFRRNEATSRHKVSSDDETTLEQSVIRCWMSVQQSNSSRPFNGLNLLSMKGRFIKKNVFCSINCWTVFFLVRVYFFTCPMWWMCDCGVLVHAWLHSTTAHYTWFDMSCQPIVVE